MSRISLNDRQEYIAREMIEEYRAGHITRRAMLKTISAVCGAAGGAALLSACGDDDGAQTLQDGGLDAAGSPDGGAAEGGAPEGGSPDSIADAGAVDAAPGVLSVPANDPAIQASRIEYDSTGGAKIIGYLARPAAAGSYPGVIVIHENRGLNDHIRDVARRLAKANFVALAPDLTSRGGSTETLDPNAARAYLSMDGVAETLLADLVAAATHLGGTAGVVPGDKLGVVGFCFGGGQTYRLAVASTRIAAAVPYYGPAPTPVVATLKDARAAFLIHHAETDPGVNATREEVRAALTGKTVEIVVHPGTGHAFNNDTSPAYNEAEAVAAWTRTLAWFRTHLR